MSDLATLEAAGDLTAHAGEKRLRPLDALPAELRKPVGFFWALNKHLLPSPTPLVLRFQVWQAREKLTAAEVKQVLGRLAGPEASAGHRFASDLLCDLAQAVADVLKRRRQVREQADRRAADEREAAEAVRPDQWPAELRGLLTGNGTGL